MAGLETLVALMRNGLCVCVDTLPSTHLLKLPLKAILLEVGKLDVGERLAGYTRIPVAELSVLNVGIAALQVCAVWFNATGALGLGRCVADYRRLVSVERRLALKSRSRAAEVGARHARLHAASNMAFTVVRLMLAPAFGVLALYTLKVASQRLLEWALALMQVALGIALWAMVRQLKYRRRKAEFAAAASEGPSDDPEELVVVDDLVDQEGGLPSHQGLVAIVAAAHDPDTCGEQCASWARIAKKLAEENPSGLVRLAQRERDTCFVDGIVLGLNCIAFLGYLVFPATYFGPFKRDPDLEWLGNFAGDLAWTLEPALIILVAARQRVKLKAE